MAIALSPAERELVITRVFNAPRELVFKAWIDPKLAIRWWGPRHHPATHMQMDPRPGGVWRHRLTSPETGHLWHHGVFREVVPPERLVFTFVWEEEGERGVENLVTITFAEEAGNKTRLTLWQTPFLSVAERDGHSYGWNSTFDRLEDHLAHDGTSA